MTTYSEHQQRELDQQSGEAMDRHWSDHAYPHEAPHNWREIEHGTAVLRADELLELLKRAVSGAPNWRHDGQRLLAEIAAGIPPQRLLPL